MRVYAWAVLAVALCVGTAAALADGSGYLRACARKGDEGKPDEAVGLCTRAINAGDLSERDLFAAYVSRSISYYGLRKFDDSIADCKQALSLRPDDFQARMTCADAYGAKGDFTASLEQLDQAESLEPDDAAVHNNRANHLNQIGEYAKALEEVDAALRIEPDHLFARINRGVVLFNLGRFAEAAKALEAATDQAPGSAYALLWLTIARQRAGIAMKPQDVAAAASNIDHESWPWPIVAHYAGEKIDFAEAVRFGNASAGSPASADQDCEASFYYGEMAIIRGDTAEAKQRLQHAADTCSKIFIEHASALAELKRM